MNFTLWTNEALQNRLQELRSIGENPGDRTQEQLDALVQERQAIDAEIETRRRAAAQAELRREQVASGAVGGNVIGMAPASPEHRTYDTGSPEYRTGFLKTMLHQELTAEERSAVDYVMTTGDTTNHTDYLLPKTLLQEIWSLIEEEHSILQDVTLYRTGTILEIPLHVSISQGDAATVNENAANDDEINVWGKVTLAGKDFSKHIDISYAMAKMSIDALEGYLRTEIADRIGAALATDVITQILADYDDDHNAVSTANALKVEWTDITGALALLKNGKGGVVFYANNSTIYSRLVGMVDTTGRPIFQPNAQAGAEGTLVGFPVKREDGVANDKILIGYPKTVVGNIIQDIMVETDRDIKKHVITHSGYARYDAKLIQPASFAKLTVKQS